MPHDPQFIESVVMSTHAVVAPDAHCICPEGHETSGGGVSDDGESSSTSGIDVVSIEVSATGTSPVPPSG